MRKTFGALVAVALLAGLGWVGSGQAAAPIGNGQLNVDITVTVPAVTRIEWGSTSTMVGAVPGGIGNATWAIGNVGFSDTVLSTTGGVLSIKNKGTSKVGVTAAMKLTGTDTDGCAGFKWTLGAAPANNTYAVLLTPAQPANQGPNPQPVITTEQLTTTGAAIVIGLRVSHAEMPFVLTYSVPADADTVDGQQHSHEVQLIAAAE